MKEENSKVQNILFKELKKASKSGEVPVAALITLNGKIISKAHNKVSKCNSILNHAEILAIEKASKKLKNWRLNNCIMYVTLEPCSMCNEIIKKSRLSKVIYYSKQNLYKTENECPYEYKENKQFSKYLSDFFKNIRK